LVENTSSPSRDKQAHALRDQPGVVALHIQHALHAGGVRERGRVEEDQVERRRPALLLRKPLQAVCLQQRVAVCGEAVQLEVGPCPVQIGAGQVDASVFGAAAAACRLATPCSRTGSEARALAAGSDAAASADDQETGRVEVVVKIHPHFSPASSTT
jgi:hypothetical protein